MKHKILLVITLVCSLFLLNSCNDKLLMYDTDQKPQLYFNNRTSISFSSFAFAAEDQLEIKVAVFLLGMPKNEDREFKLELVPCQDDAKLTISEKEYRLKTAKLGEHFELPKLILPAGEVSTEIKIKLNRTADLLEEGTYHRIGLKIVENENFKPCADESFTTSKISFSSDYKIYFNDGEPICPDWWSNSGARMKGWAYILGRYYPAKYRKMLALFRETKKTCPQFYNHIVDKYGENLDTPNVKKYGDPNRAPEKEIAKMFMLFWQKDGYYGAWVRYVFIPLYDYYDEYYKTHPDDPNKEPMDELNIMKQEGWRNPRKMLN